MQSMVEPLQCNNKLCSENSGKSGTVYTGLLAIFYWTFGQEQSPGNVTVIYLEPYRKMTARMLGQIDNIFPQPHVVRLPLSLHHEACGRLHLYSVCGFNTPPFRALKSYLPVSCL